jgi:quercetin dioxygenase-like cupin family protein
MPQVTDAREKIMSLRATIWRTGIPLLAAAAFGLANAPGAHAQDATVALPDGIQWGPAPPGLPPGSEAALLYGDPSQEGTFVVLARFPPGYEIPPHTHPTIEMLTVLSGNLNFGHGEALDRESAEVLPAGSFVSLPANHPHFLWADEETVVQVVGEGPFDIAYLDPADDPRQQ